MLFTDSRPSISLLPFELRFFFKVVNLRKILFFLLVVRFLSSGHLLLVFLLSLQVVLGEVAVLAETVGVVGLVTMGTSRCHFGLRSTGVEGTGVVPLDVVLDLLLDLLVENIFDALTLQDLHLLEWCLCLRLQSIEQKRRSL